MNERRQKADPALRYLQRMQAGEAASAATPRPANEKSKKPGQLDKVSQFVADYPVGSEEVNPDPEADIRANGIRKRTQEIITQAYEVAIERDTRRNQEQRNRMAERVVMTRSALAALLLCTAAGAFGAGWWLAPAGNGRTAERRLALADLESGGVHGDGGWPDSDETGAESGGLARGMWCPSCQKWASVPPDVLLGRTGSGAVCPVHRVPLLAERPGPQRDPSRPQ